GLQLRYIKFKNQRKSNEAPELLTTDHRTPSTTPDPFDPSKAKGLPDLIHLIEFFPGKEFHFLFDPPVIGGLEHLFKDSGLFAHMPVSGGFQIDGISKFEAFLYGKGPHVEQG